MSNNLTDSQKSDLRIITDAVDRGLNHPFTKGFIFPAQAVDLVSAVGKIKNSVHGLINK